MRGRIAMLIAALGFVSSPARAQDEEPGGRGVVGGALLGAELVVVTEAIAGVEPAWAYLVGGALGAGAGAYAGSIVEEQTDAEVSLVLLAAGVALVIPTAVLVGNLTADRPPPSDHVRLLPPSVRVSTARGGSATLDLLRGQF